MKIPQIKFSLDKKNKLSAMRSSFQTFCSRADALMSMNSDSVSLLSLSQKNTNTARHSSLIDLILKHI